MTDISIGYAPASPASVEAPARLRDVVPALPDRFQLPTPRRTFTRLLRAWTVSLTVFGYGPAFTYGKLAWLFNEHQWSWTYLLYVTEVPLVGGLFVLVLPLLWYRPIHRAMQSWSAGGTVDRTVCAAIYRRALQLPWRVAVSAFVAALFGYLIGMSILHWQANQPWVEIVKTFPAIPLVGGMMGAYGYFATARALHPVVAWCSIQLGRVRPMRQVLLEEKFLTTTVVLAVAILCLLQPAAYTLGQVVTEHHLTERALGALRGASRRIESLVPEPRQWVALQQAVLGSHGYLFVTDTSGRLLSPHPRGYADVGQERFYRLDRELVGRDGVWVDRFGRHRVVAFVRFSEPERTAFSVVFPSDFSQPLHAFMRFSWFVLIEVLCVVFLFGRYFTRGITTPLAELTRVSQRIAESGNLSLQVPVTTTDELSELAQSFNRMVDQLQVSQAELERYTQRLERSTRELSLLNQEMEDLLRVVSHDLRAPLINIQGFSKRLEPIMHETITILDQLGALTVDDGLRGQVDALKGSARTRFTESLRFISKGVEKMDALLSSLLAISRVGRKADPIQPNDLDEIVDDVLATLDHQLKDQCIQVVRHALPKGVPCRRNELNQVFSNLVSNAISYMGPTGNRFVEIGGAVQGSHAECYVRDTGIGIHPDDQERVFQMFTRLHAVDIPGEGVGLAYVKKIIRSHGGEIRVVSQRGQGSTFLFTLPLRQPTTRG